MGDIVNPFISFGGFKDLSSIPDLAAWYTARVAASITVDGSDIVTEWADQTGLGNHAGPSGHTDPIYDGTDTISSIAVPNFNNAGAADCGLAIPVGLIRNLAGCTVIAVAAPSGSARALHGFGFSRFSSGVWLDFEADTSWKGGKKRVSGDTDQTVSGGSYTDDTPYIITQWVDWQNTTMRLRVNGSQVAESTSFQSSGNSADVDASDAYIGMASFDARSWRGLIGEWALIQRPIDADEIADAEAYLSDEWSISI